MNELKLQIEEFEIFRDDIERQQLKSPLDQITKNALWKDLPIPPDINNAFFPFTTTPQDELLEVILNNKKMYLYEYPE